MANCVLGCQEPTPQGSRGLCCFSLMGCESFPESEIGRLLTAEGDTQGFFHVGFFDGRHPLEMVPEEAKVHRRVVIMIIQMKPKKTECVIGVRLFSDISSKSCSINMAKTPAMKIPKEMAGRPNIKPRRADNAMAASAWESKPAIYINPKN